MIMNQLAGIKTYFGVFCINEGYGLHREIMMKLFIEILGSIFKKNKFQVEFWLGQLRNSRPQQCREL